GGGRSTRATRGSEAHGGDELPPPKGGKAKGPSRPPPTADQETRAQGHRRPSAIRSLIFSPPRVTDWLRSRMRLAAPRAVARSGVATAGTSLTGLPRRVIKISAPRCTPSRSADSLFLASKASISYIAASI